MWPQTAEVSADLVASLTIASSGHEPLGRGIGQSLIGSTTKLAFDSVLHVIVNAAAESSKGDSLMEKFDGGPLSRQDALNRIRLVSGIFSTFGSSLLLPLATSKLGAWAVGNDLSGAEIGSLYAAHYVAVATICAGTAALYMVHTDFRQAMNRQAELATAGGRRVWQKASQASKSAAAAGLQTVSALRANTTEPAPPLAD
jgi:hypothetical protein